MYSETGTSSVATGLLPCILDASMDAIIIADANHRVTAFSRAAEKLFGYRAERVVGQPIDMLIPERFRDIYRRHIAGLGKKEPAIRDGDPIRVIYGLHANGGEFAAESSIRCSNEPGSVRYVFTLHDISKRKKNERQIDQLTSAYSALSQVNHCLTRCRNAPELFNETCRIAVESGGMRMAWIGVLDESTRRIMPVASYGHGRDYLEGIEISAHPDCPEGNGPTGMALREARPIISQDYFADAMTAPYHERAKPYGWRASATFPIIRGDQPRAVLNLYHDESHSFTVEIIELMMEMADNIGHGLHLFDLEESKRKVEESMTLAAAIYRSSAEAVVITDENNLIIDANPAFAQQTGYTLEDVRGKNPRIFKSGNHPKVFYEEMWRSILANGHWQGELWDRRKDGSLHAKFASISLIRHPDGSAYRHVAQFFDITDKKQKEEVIWKQANFDPLTGLPNRRLFHDRLEQEAKKASRARTSLALLFIDLDRFKEVNDTLGHAKGDLLLKEAARRISGCVRESDTVARLGGDEFTLILRDFGGRTRLEHIAQDLIQALSQSFDLGGGESGYISASVGITLYPDDARDLDELIKHADQAMYAAKAEGRNRFSYFTRSMQREAREKLDLTNELRLALHRNELEVYYQPIVDLANGHLVKAEALLRWHHPRRGIISPAVFIPLAEESGAIHEIGDWVFQQAIASIACWKQQFARIIPVSVNMSPVQFERQVRYPWMNKLESAGLPPGCITAEITERVLIKDMTNVKQRLLEFWHCGIEVSIDDFGTGFSALSYLKQLDIDYLKIDRCFVAQLTERESDMALTEAIIVMAHKLGMKTIAEGVEDREQRDILAKFGCDYAQGALFSMPVPAERFAQLLA